MKLTIMSAFLFYRSFIIVKIYEQNSFKTKTSVI